MSFIERILGPKEKVDALSLRVEAGHILHDPVRPRSNSEFKKRIPEILESVAHRIGTVEDEVTIRHFISATEKTASYPFVLEKFNKDEVDAVSAIPGLFTKFADELKYVLPHDHETIAATAKRDMSDSIETKEVVRTYETGKVLDKVLKFAQNLEQEIKSIQKQANITL